ncbi:MAG: hypothetical protein AABZ34_04510 [Nitrospirota bacterium]
MKMKVDLLDVAMALAVGLALTGAWHLSWPVMLLTVGLLTFQGISIFIVVRAISKFLHH